MPCTSEICQNKVDMIWNPLIEDLPFFTRFRLPQSLHVCGRSQPSARTCRDWEITGDSGLRLQLRKNAMATGCRTKMKQLATSSSKKVRNWSFSAPFWGSRLFSWSCESCALSFWGAQRHEWVSFSMFQYASTIFLFLAGDGMFRNETSNQTMMIKYPLVN